MLIFTVYNHNVIHLSSAAIECRMGRMLDGKGGGKVSWSGGAESGG